MGRSALIPFALLVGVTGCGNNPFGPLAGAYRLESIGSDPLPAVYFLSNHATIRMLESTIEFRTETRGREHQRAHHTSSSDPTGAIITTDVDFSYRVVGDRIEITYDCADSASCVAGPHLVGSLVGSRLEFDVAMGRTPLIYRPD